MNEMKSAQNGRGKPRRFALNTGSAFWRAYKASQVIGLVILRELLEFVIACERRIPNAFTVILLQRRLNLLPLFGYCPQNPQILLPFRKLQPADLFLVLNIHLFSFIFNNPETTTGIEFLIPRKLEVIILFRKSQGI